MTKETRGIVAPTVIMFLVMTLLPVLCSCTKEKQVQYRKTVNGVTVTITPEKGNFVVGKNDGVLTVADSSGKKMNVGNIMVRFFIPNPKDGMTYDFSPAVSSKDGEYRFVMEFQKAGEWRMEMNTFNPDSIAPPLATDFVINVRTR